LTEAAPGMTATRIDDSFDVRCNTVGRDFEFTEVKVIDPETGEECPVGVQGEMCNRGYNTMKGYYKNPEATAEVIDENNFLHSGDLGIKDEDGNYRITGRIKDMIIRGGENIYPREIEEFLYKLDGVKRCTGSRCSVKEIRRGCRCIYHSERRCDNAGRRCA